MGVMIEERYPAGHSYTFEWCETDLFCPGCGVKSVWHENHPGDYYVDERYACAKCRSMFYLPGVGGQRNRLAGSGTAINIFEALENQE